MSWLLARAASRPATLNKAANPGGNWPRCMRCKPCATKRRLLASSFTTSATVPKATSGNKPSSLGSVSLLNTPRVRNAARSASNT